jgi:outer membrane protein assembly factor BamA
MTFEGNKVFPSEDIRKKLKVVPGKLFVPELFRLDVKGVEDYYLEKGY